MRPDNRLLDPTALRPLRALRGLVTVVRDPEQTEAGAVMVGCLTGRSWERLFERFAADPMGARILAEGRRLDRVLLDRDGLAARPAGSLGRAYFEWTRDEGIDAAGLLDITRDALPVSNLTPECELFANRERVAHDLWHVVTGYGRDLLGEAALLHMMWLQTRNTGFVLPVFLSSLAHTFDTAGRRVILEARRRARRSVWLPAQDWETLLDQPLTRVREKLRLGEPPVYTPVFRRQRPHLASARS
jgi:ubiquinone biosynthesis protein COQ4